jgi:hypothetical protein
MADNTAQDGTSTIATDDIGGVHWQKVKVAFGASDTGTLVEAAVGLPVNVLDITPGTGATDLGKAEDAAHSSGDTGVAVLAVRKDTAAALAGTDGDYANLEVDAVGALHVAQAALAVGTDEIAGPSITALTVNCASSGNNTLKTPGSGNFLRVWYWSYALIGTTAVEVNLRPAAAGALRYAAYLPSQGSFIGHNIKPCYWDLAVDEALIANLSGAVASGVDVTVEYEELTP